MIDSAPVRLSIVGAGPGGLTAAITAARQGLVPTVFERASAFARMGGGIVIHSNGLRVLERLGLLEAFEPLMVPCRTFTLQLGDRYELVSDYGELAIPQNYFAVVLRYELQDFLLAAAQRVAPIRFGHRCTAVRQKSGHVQLQCESGQTIDCETVIGADGAHSGIHSSLRIEVVRRTAGDAYLRGISTFAGDHAEAREIWGIDGRRFGMTPLTHARTYFYRSAPRGRWDEVRTAGLDRWIERLASVRTPSPPSAGARARLGHCQLRRTGRDSGNAMVFGTNVSHRRRRARGVQPA